MEMRCYRILLSISHKEHITNDKVRRRIENSIGPHVDLMTIVRQRKQKWYWHATRSSGLAKTIMQASVTDGRGGGRDVYGCVFVCDIVMVVVVMVVVECVCV
ncbi:retrovirus-related Pol polyprotein LINE-1 [Elysia marginata]|uniref:Retrovirus-related Pol polyprotein LINE-1 n=1 Tax=Elysia marginata TaxID=1093978 RepID=A0AAV4I1A1_9GAST|nr:retrovirus-related Pol polyprotein LINE-1 [Elysia marginata]